MLGTVILRFTPVHIDSGRIVIMFISDNMNVSRDVTNHNRNEGY